MEPVTPQKKRPRKKGLPVWAVLLTLIVVIAGFAGAVHFAYLPKNGIELETTEADLRQKLTIGASTRDDAKAWFASRGLSEIHEIADTGGNKNGYMVRIPNDSWMKQTEIEILVRFDGTGKLNQITIYQTKRE